MQRLDINLASRPFRNNSLLWLGYGGATLALIAFSAWNVASYRGLSAELSDLRLAVVNVDQKSRELDQREGRARQSIRRFDLDTLALQASKANEVIEWKAFSWTRLFNRMAEIQPYKIKMTAIRPIFRGGGARGGRSSGRGATVEFTEDGRARSVPVLVEGVARDFDDMWEFQNALLEAPYFGRVDPERLSRALNGEIVFQLRFAYYPGEKGPDPSVGAPGEAAEPAVDTAGAAEQAELDAPRPAATEPEPPARKLPPPVAEPEAEPLAAAGVEPRRLPAATDEPAEAPVEAAVEATAPIQEQPRPGLRDRNRGRRTLGKGKLPLKTKGQDEEERRP